MLEAWKNANAREKWFAIAHKDALDDRMQNWDDLSEIKTAVVTATEGSYRAFGASVKKPVEIRDEPPPFGVTVEVQSPVDQSFIRITPDNLDRGRARLFHDRVARVTITPPPGEQLTAASIKWVHMRDSNTVQPKITQLFRDFTAVQPNDVDLALSGNAVVLTVKGSPQDSLAVLMTTQTDAILNNTGMERHHSFIWPFGKITTASGKQLSFSFSTTGFLFI